MEGACPGGLEDSDEDDFMYEESEDTYAGDFEAQPPAYRKRLQAPTEEEVLQRRLAKRKKVQNKISGMLRKRNEGRGPSVCVTVNNTNCNTNPAAKPNVVSLDDFRNAAMRGNIEGLKNCLASGIRVDVILAAGWTALMYAAHSGEYESVALLLKNGASAKYHSDMYTALMAACSCQKKKEGDVFQCVEKLLQAGAKVHGFDKYHMTALLYAAKRGYSSVIKKLCEFGANVNDADNEGYTALMRAAEEGHLRAVHALLDLGADLTKQNSKSFTVFDIAIESRHMTVHDLLEQFTPGKAFKNVEDEPEVDNEASVIKKSTVDAYGELEIFLSGLDLAQLIPLFKEHLITFPDLLRMTDHDLQQMGIHQLGSRKKMLDAIHSVHKKEWKEAALPSIVHGKQLTCAEAIAMLKNIKLHLSLVGSTVGYISDQFQAHLNIISKSKGNEVNQVLAVSHETGHETELLLKEVAVLTEFLDKALLNKSALPADFLVPKAIKGKEEKKSRSVSKGILTVIVVAPVLAYFLNGVIKQHLN